MTLSHPHGRREEKTNMKVKNTNLSGVYKQISPHQVAGTFAHFVLRLMLFHNLFRPISRTDFLGRRFFSITRVISQRLLLTLYVLRKDKTRIISAPAQHEPKVHVYKKPTNQPIVARKVSVKVRSAIASLSSFNISSSHLTGFSYNKLRQTRFVVHFCSKRTFCKVCRQ